MLFSLELNGTSTTTTVSSIRENEKHVETIISMLPLPSSSSACFSSNLISIRFRRAAKISISMSMSSSYDAFPPPPENRVVVGCGMTTVDFLATVDGFQNPDDKVRTTSFKVQGRGNAGNAITCAARLGLKPKLISKVADDAQGRDILNELQADGADTSFIVVSKGGSSTFSYVLINNQTKTRTSIYTTGEPPMMPDNCVNLIICI